MKYVLSVLLVVGIVILFVLAGHSSDRIEVANTGINVVEVETEGTENKLLLGENGTGYFDQDSRIHIGDAAIKLGRRVEIVNTGSGMIQIAYCDSEGSQRTLILGQGGTGYLSKSIPFRIDDVSICIGKIQ